MQQPENTWIKSLVRQEDHLEATGEISFQAFPSTSSEELLEHTVEFLRQLRTGFTQTVSSFNQMKGYIGSIRIYGISETDSDFMIFRNGYKLVFSVQEAGLVSIKFLNTQELLPGQEPAESPSIEYIKGVWGAFGELKWMHAEQPLKIDFLIRYFMTHFVRQSIR